jgi:integrase/recombinase XerD
MCKKKMATRKKLTTYSLKLFSPNALDQQWMISFYQLDPVSGQRKRFRMTFNMNRIRDLSERKKFALAKMEEIRRMLPHGYPFTDGQPARKSIGTMSVKDGIRMALNIKLNTDRDKSRNSYRSYCNIFFQYLELNGLSDRPLDHFTRADAMAFLDHIVTDRKVSPVTHNNYMTVMRSFFTELINRELITTNPFSNIREKKTGAKMRRSLAEYEQRIIATEIFERDKLLMLAVLLIYHCFIRPTELRRLRFKHFDLQKSTINMPGEITKNRDSSIVTIPKVMMNYLFDFGFHKYHPNLLVFGAHGSPDHHQAIGEHTLNNRHQKILQVLKKKNYLQDIEGISLYSWKDSGAMDMLSAGLSIVDLKNQIRHKNLQDTQLYLKALSDVNERILNLTTSILPN